MNGVGISNDSLSSFSASSLDKSFNEEKEERSGSPSTASSTGSSQSSGTSSSSSGTSGSSSDSSSSDTEHSSAISTRSRSNSCAALNDRDESSKSQSSSKRGASHNSKASTSHNNVETNKKESKSSPLEFPFIKSTQTQLRSRSRISSDSEPEPVSTNSKRGPKTSATSVPKNSSNALHKANVASRSQNSHSRKTVSSVVKTSSVVASKKGLKDKKSRNVSQTSDSETDYRFQKSKPLCKKPIGSRNLQKVTLVNANKSKMDKLTKDIPKRGLKKHSGKVVAERTSESSTNSSSSSTGSESDSSSESSQSTTEKNKKKTEILSQFETDKEEDGEERQDGDDSPRRLITRSSSVKTKRSSLLGINKGTDSDSENVSKNRRTNKSEQRTVRPFPSLRDVDSSDTYTNTTESLVKSARTKTKKPIQKVKNNILEQDPLPPIEKRRCPVDGCNSSGHLAGKYDRHFTVEACPIFHNITKEECKANREIRIIEQEERNRAVIAYGNRSPTSSEKAERRNYVNMIRDAREKMSETIGDEEDIADCDRQPSLRGLTPEWDLQLFLQAQAMASEKNEEEMKGLPDTQGIRFIQMGHFEMEAWYQSQYPDDYNQQPKIFVCEFCLKYMRSNTILLRHAEKCVWKHPPGEEIYRRDKISVWEVDGHIYKSYCQNLCLLAMLFLDHKTLYYDVEPFLFYIMTTVDSEGYHIIGYFSKEKNSFLNYNVSCIMTLPPYQRKGYGRLLIDFSYLLTKEEGKIGSPEKPLSDLGLISYRSYWKDLLLEHLSHFKDKNVSVKDLSTATAVSSYDIVSTFQAMGMMKYWKGKHILLKRQDLFEEFDARYKRRQIADKEIRADCLCWTPYVPPQSDDTHSNGGSNTNGKTNKSSAKKRPSDSRYNNNEQRNMGNSTQTKVKRPYFQHMTNGK